MQLFRPTGGGIFLNPYQEDGELVAKQIFDQARPKSIMAQQLDEASPAAISGPSSRPRQRRSSIDFSPRASSSSRMIGRAAAVRTQEPRRAVVVGVVQKEDVPARAVAVVLRAIEAGVAGASSPGPTATTAPVASRDVDRA